MIDHISASKAIRYTLFEHMYHKKAERELAELQQIQSEGQSYLEKTGQYPSNGTNTNLILGHWLTYSDWQHNQKLLEVFIRIVNALPLKGSAAEIGDGIGPLSMIMKIIRPDWDITLIHPNEKTLSISSMFIPESITHNMSHTNHSKKYDFLISTRNIEISDNPDEELSYISSHCIQAFIITNIWFYQPNNKYVFENKKKVDLHIMRHMDILFSESIPVFDNKTKGTNKPAVYWSYCISRTKNP